MLCRFLIICMISAVHFPLSIVTWFRGSQSLLDAAITLLYILLASDMALVGFVGNQYLSLVSAVVVKLLVVVNICQ